MGYKAERRPGPGEIWPAVTKHDGVQVDSILIDQAKFGQAVRQVRASNFDRSCLARAGLNQGHSLAKSAQEKGRRGEHGSERCRDRPPRPHVRRPVPAALSPPSSLSLLLLCGLTSGCR